MVSHVLSVLVPATICAIAAMNPSFFSWHPVLMSVSFGLLMTQAILIFSKESSLAAGAKHPWKVDLHAKLMLPALAMVLGGFVVIYVSKNRKDRPHFTTWHGLLGLIAVIYICIQVPAGIALKNARFLKLPRPALIGFAHGLSGTFLYLLGSFVLILGLMSTWFEDNANFYVKGLLMVGCVLNGMAIMQQCLQKIRKRFLPGAAKNSGQKTD